MMRVYLRELSSRATVDCLLPIVDVLLNEDALDMEDDGQDPVDEADLPPPVSRDRDVVESDDDSDSDDEGDEEGSDVNSDSDEDSNRNVADKLEFAKFNAELDSGDEDEGNDDDNSEEEDMESEDDDEEQEKEDSSKIDHMRSAMQVLLSSRVSCQDPTSCC